MPTTRRRHIPCVIAIGAVVALPHVAAAQPQTMGETDTNPVRHTPSNAALGASIRLGAEADDNALRQSTSRAQADVLTRYFASLDLASIDGPHALLFNLSQGGKLFARESDGRHAAHPGQPRVAHRLGRAVCEFHRPVARSQGSHRAHLAAGLQPRRRQGRGGARAWARSTCAPTRAGATLVTSPTPPQARTAPPPRPRSLGCLVRNGRYRPPICTCRGALTRAPTTVLDPSIAQTQPTDEQRRDAFHAVRTALDWRGPLLASLAYTLSLNGSNSAGQGLIRPQRRADTDSTPVVGVARVDSCRDPAHPV